MTAEAITDTPALTAGEKVNETSKLSPALAKQAAELEAVIARAMGPARLGPYLPTYPAHTLSNGRYTQQWMPSLGVLMAAAERRVAKAAQA